MSDFLKKKKKVTRHTKKYESFFNKSIIIVPEEDLMEDLLEKKFKTTVLKMLKELSRPG